jgi:serine/threonine protein kinase
VITVYDAGRDGGDVYIAMELVEGGTLRQWCAAAPRSWREVVAVFVRAGTGLAHAHAAGLVHRDFKPDNVLVGTDGRIRVTDFGLARPLRGEAARAEPTAPWTGSAASLDATLTRTGALVGTPAYMSPEQLAGRPADARSDIFSFCVAFYEALHGVRPFAGATVPELAKVIASGHVPRPPRSRVAPARLRRALLVGLRPEPERRYGSMVALLDAVRRATRPSRAAYGSLALAGVAAFALVARARSLGHAPAPDLTPAEARPAEVTPSTPGAPTIESTLGADPSARSPEPPRRVEEGRPGLASRPPPSISRRPAPRGAQAAVPVSPALAPSSEVQPARPEVTFGANGSPIIR